MNNKTNKNKVTKENADKTIIYDATKSSCQNNLSKKEVEDFVHKSRDFCEENQL